MGLLAQTKDVCDASVSFTYTAAATDFFPGVCYSFSHGLCNVRQKAPQIPAWLNQPPCMLLLQSH